jgi:predicted RNA-binding protein with PIN domain
MDIIIDGYNLIASEDGLRGVLEHKRNGLVKQLARYQKTKGFSVSVVFDGWKSGKFNETSEKSEGVTVVFSRQGEKADDVVVRLARQRGSGCVVVSSDREVRNNVEKFGATVIYAAEFNEILRGLDAPGVGDQEDFDLEFSSDRRPRMSNHERRRQEKLRKLRLP